MSTQIVCAHNIDPHSVVIFAFALLSTASDVYNNREKAKEKTNTARGGLKRIKLITNKKNECKKNIIARVMR